MDDSTETTPTTPPADGSEAGGTPPAAGASAAISGVEFDQGTTATLESEEPPP